MVQGISVSRDDGEIDWTKVAAKKQFAFARATAGSAVEDPTFQTNFKNMKAAGIKAGAYHDFDPTLLPKDQYDKISNVLKTVGFNKETDKLAISVDISSAGTKQERCQVLQSLLNELKEGGYDPIIWVSEPTWDVFYANDGYNFSTYPLWIYDYFSYIIRKDPKLPADWNNAGKSYDYWDYISSCNVDGVHSCVSLSQTPDQSSIFLD